jgi:hypothetical protein
VATKNGSPPWSKAKQKKSGISKHFSSAMEHDMGMKHIVKIDTTESVLFALRTGVSQSELYETSGFEFTECRGEIISFCNKTDQLLDIIFDILCDKDCLSTVTLSLAEEDFSVDYRTRVGYGRVRGVEEPIADPIRGIKEVYAFAVSPDRRSIIQIGKEPNHSYEPEIPF